MELDSGTLYLIALASIGLGLLYCFFGYRIFKVLLGILGFVVGASVAAKFVFDTFGGEPVLTIVAGLVGGVIGTVLLVFLYFVGVFLLGAWLGSLLGVLLTGGGESTAALVIIVVLAVMGGIVTVVFQKLMIILSTALGGSWAIVYGISHLLGGGPDSIQSFQYHPNLRALRPMGVWGYAMFLGWIILGIAGLVVQYRLAREERPEESE